MQIMARLICSYLSSKLKPTPQNTLKVFSDTLKAI